jgi:hypothetical protein
MLSRKVEHNFHAGAEGFKNVLSASPQPMAKFEIL